jgi:hypothetical protein
LTLAESVTLTAIRRLLLGIVIFGVGGMGAELLFIGHVEGVLQLIPVALLACGFAILVWHAVAPRRETLRALQALMGLFVLSGGIGVVLHYQGNVAFELEMYPTLSGMELVSRTLTGATPVLAPGSMTLLGLVGLAATYRHPLVQQRPFFGREEVS